MPKRPLARRVFEPKYFQALATQATSTKLTLRVACHGQSNLGRYPLVGPVGIPRTLILLLLKIVLMVPRPYIAYTVRGCAAGQGMVFDLSVLNRVYDLVCLSTGYFLHD